MGSKAPAVCSAETCLVVVGSLLPEHKQLLRLRLVPKKANVEPRLRKRSRRLRHLLRTPRGGHAKSGLLTRMAKVVQE